MKEILAYIEHKKEAFSTLPFFEFMRNKEIEPAERLGFAPCLAHFVMSFGRLNSSVFRQEPTTDEIQALINTHSYEDDHHWLWFLKDIKKLGLDQSQNYSDVLKFLWSDHTSHSHRLVNELYRLAMDASPVLKLVEIEVIETTGNVMFSLAADVVQELKGQTNQELTYFGLFHLERETGHTTGEDNTAQFIESIQLKEDEKQKAIEIVDYIFQLFENFTAELLAYVEIPMEEKPLYMKASKTEFDYLIIGAGPAGLQLGYYLEKTGRDYQILEAGEKAGKFFEKFPRHGKLISINKVHTGYEDPEINLRWDWNSLLSDDEQMLFKNYDREYFPSTSSLVEYLGDFAKHYELNIQYNCKVAKIAKEDKFLVTDAEGNTYTAKRLVVATGFSKPYVPPIPGIEFAENYTEVSVNPEDFANQKVLIIGKGNSAFETADNLVGTTALIHLASPNPVRMAWESKYVGHLRAVNNNILDTYQLKSQNAILDATIDSIERQGEKLAVCVSYTHAHGEQETLIYDRVIVCTGFRFDGSMFDESCRPDVTIHDRFPAQTSEWESTNIEDLYFAGVLMHVRDFKDKQSGFIHGFRYNVKALARVLDQKYHQQQWPHIELAPTSEGLTDAILERVNRSSGLWQQTGFLCDLIVVPGQGQPARYYEEMPIDYVNDSEYGHQDHYYTVTLDFGYDVLEEVSDPFAISRVHKDDIHQASKSAFIHPIIRRFHKGTLVSEHHIIEDLASEWVEPVHIQPLLESMQNQLSLTEKPLGVYLLEASLVTLEQLDAALNEQQTTKARLGDTLVSQGVVSQQTIDYIMEKVVSKSQRPLGTYLLEAGLVNQEQLDIALNEQKTTGARLGDILTSKDVVKPQTIEYLVNEVIKSE